MSGRSGRGALRVFDGMHCFRTPAIVLVMALAVAGRGVTQDLPPRLAERFTEGVGALKDGRAADAERAFKDVIAGGGNRAFVHHNLGIALEQQGRHADALAEFRAAVKLDPAFGPAHLMAGTLLLNQGRATDAVTALRRAVRLLPDQPAAHLQLAAAYERQGNRQGVVDEYRRLVDLDPANEEYAYRLGKAYLQLAQWAFERMKAIDPESARLAQALGEQQVAQGRPDLALQSFQRAERLDPTLVDVHLALARLHFDARRWDQADAEADLALKLAPESAAGKRIKAAIAAARGPR